MDKDEQPTVEELVKTVGDAGNGDEDVSVEQIVEAIGDDAFAPLMLVPALIAITPASGIPGLTAMTGLIVVLISVQLVARRRSLWLPGFILRRKISRSKLDTATRWLQRPSRLVDRLTAKRLVFLVRPPFSIVPAVICMCAGLVMPLMEFVPFSGSVMAGAIALIALSFMADDGLLALLAGGLLVAAGYLVWTALA